MIVRRTVMRSRRIPTITSPAWKLYAPCQSAPPLTRVRISSGQWCRYRR